MPRVSKVSKKVEPSARRSTRPGGVPPDKERPDKYICSRCGKAYKVQEKNFPASQSPLYSYNGYFPVCNHCVDQLYEHYRETLGSGEAAIQRICQKFDIYWNPDLWGMVNKINTSASRVRSYISKTFLVRYIGKTYDDTLDEIEAAKLHIALPESAQPEDIAGKDGPMTVDADTVAFWGTGFDAPTYLELGQRFERWTKELPKPLPIVEEAIYKQICIQEIMINRNIALGKDIEKGQNALNTLLGSLSIKPNQNKDDKNAELESTPLGVWAKRWEDHRPIPDDETINEPGLIKYITVWLYGHLAKSLGLKNMYSQVYEDEIARYRVKRPEYVDEDDDQIISDITAGGDDP